MIITFSNSEFNSRSVKFAQTPRYSTNLLSKVARTIAHFLSSDFVDRNDSSTSRSRKEKRQPFDTVEGERLSSGKEVVVEVGEGENDKRLLSKRVYCCVGDLMRVSLSQRGRTHSVSLSLGREINEESRLPVKTSQNASASFLLSLNALTTTHSCPLSNESDDWQPMRNNRDKSRYVREKVRE